MGWCAAMMFLGFALAEAWLGDHPWRLLMWALFAGVLFGMGISVTVRKAGEQ